MSLIWGILGLLFKEWLGMRQAKTEAEARGRAEAERDQALEGLRVKEAMEAAEDKARSGTQADLASEADKGTF